MRSVKFISRQIAEIRQGGLQVIKRKSFTVIGKLMRNAFTVPLAIVACETTMPLLSKQKWAYEALLSLIEIQFQFDSIPSNSAKKFLQHYLKYAELNSAAILKWRLAVYHSYWLLQDHVQMQKMMQCYMDTQEVCAGKMGLKFLNIRLEDNIFFANGSTQGYLDTHIKAMLLGWQPKHKLVSLIDSDKVANVCNPGMFKYWRKYVEVVSDVQGQKLLSPFKPYLLDDLTYVANLNGRATYIEHAKCIVQKEWEAQERAPLLQLDQEDLDHGREMMLTLGLPKNAWFVSLHVRDAGYKRESHPNSDEYDSYRNADVDTYYEAISAIIKRGGYVIRVGDPKMKPIRKMEGLIDYAKSEVRSNRLDVFLFSQCRFFIGTSSGPILTPFLFGTPVVGTNYAPITARLHAGNSLVIHKLIKDVEKNRILTFEEVLSSDIGRGFTSHFYKSKGLLPIDNTPSEITGAAIEMLDYLEGKLQYSAEDEVAQDKINSMYCRMSGYGNLGRVGQAFLRNVVQQGLLA
jgi:putative glycosyltransferase (TIGR04372 family)